jgi:hypothetical protein
MPMLLPVVSYAVMAALSVVGWKTEPVPSCAYDDLVGSDGQVYTSGQLPPSPQAGS